MKTYRQEYPRPQFVRKEWQNLNGDWEFCIDHANSGTAKKLYAKEKLEGKIILPFCPESSLSGVGCTDFMASVWYAKNVQFIQAQIDGKIVIHVGACDYKTTVYVNGEVVGEHIGGYTSFSVDITAWTKVGQNRIVIHAEDDTRSTKQPSGKQSYFYASEGCVYTRTTGIWQTVWLEFLPKTYLQSVKINATDLDGKVFLDVKLNEYAKNARLCVEVFYKGGKLLEKEFSINGVFNRYAIEVKPVYHWDVGAPHLYDIKYTLLLNGKRTDVVESYFGIRRIDIDGYKIRLNGKSIFQRLLLDQGFYPDGIYTAPTDEDFIRDIEYAQKLGFNGARLHQKVFEERFLYHADKMGYLVWAEYGDWGVDIGRPEVLHAMLPSWIERIERDYNHPSIVCWCPYNEVSPSHSVVYTNISAVYQATKALDGTRPVIDTSGWWHTQDTDIYDVHDYEQNTCIFAERYKKHAEGKFFANFDAIPQRKDRPYMVSEFGGMRWCKENLAHSLSWGYGNQPKDEEEFCSRYERWTETMLSIPTISGFCYTQFTDIEQEQNGLYYYDRTEKFSSEVYARIRRANERSAQIEKE